MQFDKLSEIMKSCGVVGAGGAGFPSYAKLNKKADTIILNCAECEPLFTMHRQLLAKYSFEILTALNYVKEATEAKQIIVAVKPSYTDAIEAVSDKTESFSDVSIHLLPEIYPAGDEVVLIYEVTGRKVPPGKLPIEVGCIVYNVETMLNTYYAVTENRPVTRKYVTVGGAVKKSATFLVPIGTKFSYLVSLAGGSTVENPEYLSGGVMTGRLAKINDVVTKTTNAVIVLAGNHPAIMKRKTKITTNIKRSMSSCCQCRTCTDLCPRHMLGYPIEPHLFMRAVSKGTENDVKAVLNTVYCAQCGICEMFACPQGLAPKTLIAECKKRLRESGVVPDKPKMSEVNPMREYRKISMQRIIAREGLSKYVTKSYLSDEVILPDELKIQMRQHIGNAAVSIVKNNDFVHREEKIATVGSELGCDIYSPIDGLVIDVQKNYIVIRSKKG